MSTRSCRVDQQWGEVLHPPKDRHVVNIDTPLRQHLFNIPVRQRITQVYHQTATMITSGGNRNPAEIEIRRNPISAQTLGQGGDASTQPAQTDHPPTQRCRSPSPKHIHRFRSLLPSYINLTVRSYAGRCTHVCISRENSDQSQYHGPLDPPLLRAEDNHVLGDA